MVVGGGKEILEGGRVNGALGSFGCCRVPVGLQGGWEPRRKPTFTFDDNRPLVVLVHL